MLLLAACAGGESKEDILSQTWDCLSENDPETFELSMRAMFPTADDIDDARDQFIYVGSAAPIEDLKASRDEICGASASMPTAMPTATPGSAPATPPAATLRDTEESRPADTPEAASTAPPQPTGTETNRDSGTGATGTSLSFKSVSAGPYHTCGVTTDASVACWGYYNVVQATPPDGSFVSVSVADAHTCGVRSGGSAPTSRWTDVPQPSILPPATSNWPFLLVCTERAGSFSFQGLAKPRMAKAWPGAQPMRRIAAAMLVSPPLRSSPKTTLRNAAIT